MRELQESLDTDNDGRISKKEIIDAINILKKAHGNKTKSNDKSNVNDNIIHKGLIQENFI